MDLYLEYIAYCKLENSVPSPSLAQDGYDVIACDRVEDETLERLMNPSAVRFFTTSEDEMWRLGI